MIVADASLVVEALARRGEARDRILAEPVEVPHLIDAEIVSAMRGQVRRGTVSAADGGLRVRRWASMVVRRHDASRLVGRVWQLRDVLSAYDATYVALAEALGCPLVTCDERLGRASGPGCPVMVVIRA